MVKTRASTTNPFAQQLEPSNPSNPIHTDNIPFGTSPNLAQQISSLASRLEILDELAIKVAFLEAKSQIITRHASSDRVRK